ncbi:MAG TPA: amidase, partial [Chloroflexota bacterium]|nr:amidase [Chloroflexota bacterium]
MRAATNLPLPHYHLLLVMSLYQRHPSIGTRARLDAWAAAAGIPAPVIEDAERQLNGMIAGIDELIDTYPMLADPASTNHLPHSSPSSAGSLNPRTGSTSTTAADPPPPSNALPALSITQLSDLLKRREISPFEVTRLVLDRIEAHDRALRTFILVTADQALAAARRAEAEIAAGDYRGPLHGVPVAAKDLYDIAGVPTTAGSAILRDYVPAADSAAVAAWRAAGAVLLGKNTLHEFAFGGTSVNEHTGTPRNPWNPEHMCGGSSGGSAAAVAAGFAYGAFGSETGNSVRRPAAFCGVVGLKPTYGRYSRRGVVALAWSLDHVGVFARTPSDAALLVEPLTTFDPTDPGSRRPPTPTAASLTPLEDLRGRRVGVPRALLTGIDPEVAAAFEGALDGLRAAGTEVLDID